MISPELLTRYPFFNWMNSSHINAVAAAAEEIQVKKGDVLYKIDKPADYLLILVGGTIEHCFTVIDSQDEKIRKEFYLSDINPGEVFALSSLISPYRHTTTARCTNEGHVIRVDAAILRTLVVSEPRFGANLMTQVANALYDKLESTRVQLAEERA